jgi:hypothetical protein
MDRSHYYGGFCEISLSRESHMGGSSGGYSPKKDIVDTMQNPELTKRVMGVMTGKLKEYKYGLSDENYSSEHQTEILRRGLEIITDSRVKIELKRKRMVCIGFDTDEIMGSALYEFEKNKLAEKYSGLLEEDRKDIDRPFFEPKREQEFLWIPGPDRYSFILTKNFDLEE